MKAYTYLFFIILFILVGCKDYSPATDSVKSVTNVSVRTEYIYDTLYYQLPASEKSIVTKDTISTIQNEYNISTAILSNGLLYHSLVSKDIKIPIEVRQEIVTKDSIVYVDKIKTETIEVEKPLTFFHRFVIVALLVIVLFGIGIFIAYKYNL